MSDKQYELAFGTALVLYPLPFLYELHCVETPFNAGFRLAVRYLSVPAALFVLFGCRRFRTISARRGEGVGARVFVNVGLFGLIVLFGQPYIVLVNELLRPQHSVRYEGTVTRKFRSGKARESHVVEVQVSSPEPEVIRFEVDPDEYADLAIGDAVSKEMTRGALGIPYVDWCRSER